jgi:hypothetical protein
MELFNRFAYGAAKKYAIRLSGMAVSERSITG